MFIHLAARAFIGRRPFASVKAADWFWPRFREQFPDALSACLMPDHTHSLHETRDPAADARKLAHLLAALTRYHYADGNWSVGEPKVIPNADHLRRNVRYVSLNPCRAELVNDPLSWRYSTYRGLMGAEVDPWVTPERLAPILQRPVIGFRQELHAYVSGDPSVDPAGTPLPKAAPRSLVPVVPLESVIRAAFVAAPFAKRAMKRRLAVQLALHQGWNDAALIAQSLGITANTVRTAMRCELPLESLHAAAL